MAVRAKFVCVETGEQGYGKDNITCKVVLQAVHGTYGDSEENKEFFKYTPYGKVELGVVNPEAAAQFKVGQQYYVDFTPAES